MADDLEQRIRERAYEIWENEGCPEGRGDEHWRQACAEYREAQEEAGAEQRGSLSEARGPAGERPPTGIGGTSPGTSPPLSSQGRT